MLRPHTVLLAAATAAAISTSGCAATTINISWSRPPRLPLTASQKIGVDVAPDSRPPTATNMINSAINLTQGQVMSASTAVDPLRQALTVALQREGMTVVDAAHADIVVRAVPTRWTYHLNGQLTSGSGRLDATLDVFDTHQPSGQAFFHDGYWATASGDHLGEPEVILRAADRLARAFAHELQPTRVHTQVEMDDSDPIVNAGLELCRQDQFDAAYAALSDAVQRSPSSAPALYDLGVMAEIRGSYDEAEGYLTRATGIASKAIYFSALERVRGARTDAAAMPVAQ